MKETLKLLKKEIKAESCKTKNLDPQTLIGKILDLGFPLDLKFLL